uniref:Acid sensing ion channel subunit family member 4 n=1 Tax=Junco hyemalis TaxID=40217 RepID=A0A8C5J471_JUNHY
MWLEEAQRPPARTWAHPWPSAALPAGHCPDRQPARSAPAPRQPPCSLEEFASRSTLHGIHHIFRHRRYTARNLLWLLAFLGSLALLIHAYAKCVGLYFQYPHSTQLEEETEHNKIFPAVTICNLNPARFSQLSSHDLYWAGEMLGLLDSAGRPLVPESPERSRLEALLGTLATSEEEKSRPFHLEELYERAGHQLELGEMLVRCTFAKGDCNSSDFQTAAKSALLYLEHPHVVALDEEAIREMVFPAITICNINRYRHSALTDADIFHLANMTGLPPKDRDGHKATDLLYPDPDMADIVNRTGHQLDDMLKSCNFSGENCSSRDFTVVYTRYGKCYTFNGDRRNPRVTRQGGMGNGLEIMLDIQQEEYLPIWRETNETSFEAGIRVQIHSQDEPPYIHQLGFGVSPGFQTFVSCQEQRLTYLPQPWGNCRASMQGEQLLPGYDTYSIAACRLQCEKEAVVQSCHCRMVHMPGNESICSPNVYIECADHTLDAAVEDSQERCSCPTPCNLTRYGKEISMVRIPNKGSARYLARKYNKNETYIRENFLVLDIFFEALNYEAIEQKKAYDLAGLLGDIGGQMGLFIGASILTILEILDYIYEVIRDKVSRVLRRSKPPLKKPSGSIATLGLEEMKDQSPCETLGRHVEGAYNAGILPNHHHRHHYPHQGVFEDFAC